MKRRHHSPEQIIRMLREAERLLGERTVCATRSPVSCCARAPGDDVLAYLETLA